MYLLRIYDKAADVIMKLEIFLHQFFLQQLAGED